MEEITCSFLSNQSVQRDRYLVERVELEVRPWGRQYLACLRTVWVKLDLLGSKFTPCVHVITQVDPAEGTLAQELPPAPVDGGTRSCRRREEKSVSLCTLFIDILPHSPEALYKTFG